MSSSVITNEDTNMHCSFIVSWALESKGTPRTAGAQRTQKWQSTASRERANIKIIHHLHQDCPIATVKVMKFPRWDEGRLCGVLRFPSPRSLKGYKQEPADHPRKFLAELRSRFRVSGDGLLLTTTQILIPVCCSGTECHWLVSLSTTAWADGCHQQWTRV